MKKIKCLQHLGYVTFLLLLSSCDIKGANDPYSYAPKTPDTIWEPPLKAQHRLLYQSLERDIGYNPIGALFFQEILRKETPIPKGIWSTHPPYQERQNTIYPIVRDWQQIHLSA